MFNKILIANRGEIAVRIIRACKEMRIRTVSVFSEPDRNSLHVQMADEAVCIGAAKSKDSYLNMQNIISAACLTKSQAIHPGFGFLAENATFAEMCAECKIKFIGPDAETIELMGNKANARQQMVKASVPVIPGSDGIVKDVHEALSFAESAGYPVMIKACAGGGGKGIRLCRSAKEVEKNFEAARNEAKAAFSNDSLYMEKVIENARHIEVQILADEYGKVIHLGERDCSLQRRNQKVLEEAPSILGDDLRKRLGEAAVRAAVASKYKNAGTIEFLVNADNQFYFMEMNTRLQVEHPVTEMVTGIDVVKEQIKIASGERLSLCQDDVAIKGHSIECRINALNTGNIDYLLLPGGGIGVRVDSGVYAGCKMLPFYDSMIAKVITHGTDREEAIAKMKRCLGEFVIQGIETNIDAQLDLLEDEVYRKGSFNITFLN